MAGIHGLRVAGENRLGMSQSRRLVAPAQGVHGAQPEEVRHPLLGAVQEPEGVFLRPLAQEERLGHPGVVQGDPVLGQGMPDGQIQLVRATKGSQQPSGVRRLPQGSQHGQTLHGRTRRIQNPGFRGNRTPCLEVHQAQEGGQGFRGELSRRHGLTQQIELIAVGQLRQQPGGRQRVLQGKTEGLHIGHLVDRLGLLPLRRPGGVADGRRLPQQSGLEDPPLLQPLDPLDQEGIRDLGEVRPAKLRRGDTLAPPHQGLHPEGPIRLGLGPQEITREHAPPEIPAWIGLDRGGFQAGKLGGVGRQVAAEEQQPAQGKTEQPDPAMHRIRHVFQPWHLDGPCQPRS